jgi:hypothetical protein
MPVFQHLLETRFSIRMGEAAPSLTWLEERLELLRRLTLPSVAAQTARRFTWLVFCDESTDSGVLEELRAEERRTDGMKVTLTGAGRSRLSLVASLVQPDTEVLITTRLDSDDLICDRYLEATQEYVEPFRRSENADLLLSFRHGFWLDADERRLYKAWLPNNPFHSLFERPRLGPVKTVMREGHGNLRRRYRDYRLRIQPDDGTGWHVQLHQHYPTHHDESMPAWAIGVHGGNMVNHVYPNAHEVSAKDWPPGFEALRGGSKRCAI